MHSRDKSKIIFKFKTLENLDTFNFSKNYLLIFSKNKILTFDPTILQKVLLFERLVSQLI